MHELVHQTFHAKLLNALRVLSFAGTGLPERMRSISFALLGLTAAAGLRRTGPHGPAERARPLRRPLPDDHPRLLVRVGLRPAD